MDYLWRFESLQIRKVTMTMMGSARGGETCTWARGPTTQARDVRAWQPGVWSVPSLPPLRLGGPQSGLTAHRNTKMRVSEVFKTQINVILHLAI